MRKHYSSILKGLESLLDGPEEPVHQFLKAHPQLLSPTHLKFWSKLPLGERVTDFVFLEPPTDYLLVELESPLRDIFRKDGQQREELTHAINQIADWQRFIEDNPKAVQDELGLAGISTSPRSLIVIGRSTMLTDENRRKLVTLQNQIPKLRILTFDDLVQSVRATVEHILGPLTLVGENAEIYFFKG